MGKEGRSQACVGGEVSRLAAQVDAEHLRPNGRYLAAAVAEMVSFYETMRVEPRRMSEPGSRGSMRKSTGGDGNEFRWRPMHYAARWDLLPLAPSAGNSHASARLDGAPQAHATLSHLLEEL